MHCTKLSWRVYTVQLATTSRLKKRNDELQIGNDKMMMMMVKKKKEERR
jgi:hypothetical protein